MEKSELDRHVDQMRAIEIVESSRQTHVEWRDYWLSTDCSCKTCDLQKDAAGDLAHHEQCIEDYDLVLQVLRGEKRT